jgi:Kdo2-lipid IVA lauroyltransferase/acyltransferase
MAPPKAKSPKILHQPLYLATRLGIAAASLGPLQQTLHSAGCVGRLYATSRLGRKHFTRAAANLAAAFPDWHRGRIEEHAIRSHEHLFKLGMEFAYIPRVLNEDGWPDHLELGEVGPALRVLIESRPCLLITGHCGNWEILGHTMALLGFPMHALYRPLDLPQLDRWVRVTRQRRGLIVVDKFGALKQLPELVAGGAPVGFVADQNGGDRGVFVPFFNRLTSTYKSIGLLAMQFNATIICGHARRLPPSSPRTRTGLGDHIDVLDVFGPAEWSTHPDPLFYLTARYRRAIEMMVRRAPEQYLWMHRIWRSRPRHERLGRPFPEHMAEKIRLLPWTTEADLDHLREHSARDAATLAASGADRLS